MTIELEKRGDIAVLTLNRPRALNALNFELLRNFADAVQQMGNDGSRAIIITGAGEKAFSAGADVTELVGRTLAQEKRTTELGQRIFNDLERCPIPTIALVNGYAFGGGLELALACTFRLATPNAKLGLPEIKLGLVPGYGGTQRLPRIIGQGRAMEIILSGEPIGADRALEFGLVSEIVSGDALEGAASFARRFTRHSLVAGWLARQSVLRGMQTSLDEGLKIEADLSTLSMQSEDGKDGIDAFIAKRPAQVIDR